MNNLEANALRIAELMGLKTHISIIGAFGTVISKVPNTDVINKFMDYQGLMSIVFECNRGQYAIQVKKRYVRFKQNENIAFRFFYNTEPEFIEALQLACIKYLELKND